MLLTLCLLQVQALPAVDPDDDLSDYMSFRSGLDDEDNNDSDKTTTTPPPHHHHVHVHKKGESRASTLVKFGSGDAAVTIKPTTSTTTTKQPSTKGSESTSKPDSEYDAGDSRSSEESEDNEDDYSEEGEYRTSTTPPCCKSKTIKAASEFVKDFRDVKEETKKLMDQVKESMRSGLDSDDSSNEKSTTTTTTAKPESSDTWADSDSRSSLPSTTTTTTSTPALSTTTQAPVSTERPDIITLEANDD